MKATQWQRKGNVMSREKQGNDKVKTRDREPEDNVDLVTGSMSGETMAIQCRTRYFNLNRCHFKPWRKK
jgi:hypothetical protein